MRNLAARRHAFRPLRAEDDAFLYLQAEQIGALNPAFSILDGNILQEEPDSGVIVGNDHNSGQLPKALCAYRLCEETHHLPGRRQCATLKPWSRDYQVPQ